FPAAYALIERVDQLLAGCGTGEGRAVVQRTTEAAEVQQALGRAVEGHAHAVQQVDHLGGVVTHVTHHRLVGKEVAAVDGVVKVEVRAVTLTLGVDRAVDATLGTHAVAAPHGHVTHEVHIAAVLAGGDGGHQASQSASD